MNKVIYQKRHLRRMNDARNNKKAYQASLYQQQPTGRCKAKWKGDVENDIRKMET